MKQVITFNEDGSIEFTRNKTVLGLFEGEKKSIVRMTEIEFSDSDQRFQVKFLTGPYKGRLLDHDVAKKCGVLNPFLDLHVTRIKTGSGTYLFHDYETAVHAELVVVDALRREGHSLHQ